MLRISRYFIFVWLLAIVSCDKDEDKPASGDVSFTIKLLHVVDGEPLEFDNPRYNNAFGNTYSVVRLQYFVSDFKLTRADGGVVQVKNAFYVDGREPETHTHNPQIRLPQGNYQSVSFVFGLHAETNVPGTFPNPPENNMEWPAPLGGGYHYMKLEGRIVEGESTKNYQAHTGPTDGNHNFFEVNLPQSAFTAEDAAVEIVISMDVNRWWENPNTLDLNEMTMMMGDQDKQVLLKENGTDVFSFSSE